MFQGSLDKYPKVLAKQGSLDKYPKVLAKQGSYTTLHKSTNCTFSKLPYLRYE
ncbi:hypothetical protein ACFL25_00390 [Patescibacteria group bacterium]